MRREVFRRRVYELPTRVRLCRHRHACAHTVRQETIAICTLLPPHSRLAGAVDSTMAVAAASQLHELPIVQRPPKTWTQTLHAVLFIVFFDVGCLMVNGFQFTVLLPLRLLSVLSPQAKKLYDEGIRYSKGAFGTLLGKSHSHERSEFT